MQNIQLINDLCLINKIYLKEFELNDKYLNDNFAPIISTINSRKKIFTLNTAEDSYIIIKKENIIIIGPFEKDNIIIFDNAKLFYYLFFNTSFTKKSIFSLDVNTSFNNALLKENKKNKQRVNVNIINFLEDSVKTGNIEATKIYIKILLNSLIEEKYGIERLRMQKNLVVYIFCYIFSSIENNNIDPDFNIFLTSIITSEFEFCENSSQLLFKTNQLLDKISDSFDFTRLKSNQKIKEAKYYINNNLEKKLTLEKVAKEMSISAKYLSSLFFEVTNSTFKEYVNTQRIDKAKNLLAYSEKNISEISNQIGIKSPNNFISFFKKYTFLTPTNYRDKIKNGLNN